MNTIKTRYSTDYISDYDYKNTSKAARYAKQKILAQYCVARSYIDDPEKSPKAKKVSYTFEDIEQARIARDVYDAYLDIDEFREQDGNVFPELILDRLAEARETETPLTLFVPWGVDTNFRESDGKDETTETQVLERLGQLQERLRWRLIPTQLLLMPADLYSTEINGFDQKIVDDYNDYLRELVARSGLENIQVKPWSEIRQENQAAYDTAAAEYQIALDEDEKLSGVLKKVLKSAARRTNRQDSYEAARAYCIERLCEARIIEDVYRPVKVSCVSPLKDGLLDGELPRVYITPDKIRAPWLGDLERRKDE